MSHWRVDLSWDTNTLVDGVVHIVDVLGLNRDRLESKKLNPDMIAPMGCFILESLLNGN